MSTWDLFFSRSNLKTSKLLILATCCLKHKLPVFILVYLCNCYVWEMCERMSILFILASSLRELWHQPCRSPNFLYDLHHVFHFHVNSGHVILSILSKPIGDQFSRGGGSVMPCHNLHLLYTICFTLLIQCWWAGIFIRQFSRVFVHLTFVLSRYFDIQLSVSSIGHFSVYFPFYITF